MQINIDDSAGFCWGVVRTIEIVEGILKERPTENIYVLGQIIHNPMEIKRLEEIGLKTITHKDMSRIASEKPVVIIRAHGEPPSTYETAEQLGIELIDATCPLVKRLQERIKKKYEDGWQVVIYGKREHSEVIGLRGVCNDNCTVIRTLEEAEQIEVNNKTILFSQTTMDQNTFREIKDILSSKADCIAEEFGEDCFLAKNTICTFVSKRFDKLRNFSRDNDLVIFVAGRNSSNGKILHSVCKEENLNTIFIEEISELNYSMLHGAKKIGITGATSTPQWYLQQVREEILKNI